MSVVKMKLIGIVLVNLLLISYGQTFECGEDDVGLVPDPDDCSGFYICTHEGFEHFQCDDGLLFDEELMVCNYDVDCGDRPIPGVSSTTTTTMSTFSTSEITTPDITTVTTETDTTTSTSTTTASTTTGVYNLR